MSDFSNVRWIVDEYVNALRTVLGYTEYECYASIAPAYIEGQQPTVIQVTPGAVNPSGGGSGYQEGGGLVRSAMVTLVVWRRIKLDRHGASEHVLMNESNNVLDIFESIRELFSMTTLGGLLAEPVYYEGETATTWFDIDRGVLRRDITFSNVYALELPRMVSYFGGSTGNL